MGSLPNSEPQIRQTAPSPRAGNPATVSDSDGPGERAPSCRSGRVADAGFGRSGPRRARYCVALPAARIRGTHADALITLDRQLAHAVKDLVPVAPIEALY